MVFYSERKGRLKNASFCQNSYNRRSLRLSVEKKVEGIVGVVRKTTAHKETHGEEARVKNTVRTKGDGGISDCDGGDKRKIPLFFCERRSDRFLNNQIILTCVRTYTRFPLFSIQALRKWAWLASRKKLFTTRCDWRRT